MTKLTEILAQKGRLLTTEFLPPKTPRIGGLVDKVLKVASQVDSVSLPELKATDGSFPTFRMNPIFAALRLRDLTGVETVFHLTPRDYNRNAVTGLLLGAAENHLQNVLVVGGDRYSRHEERSLSKNVYDYGTTTNLLKAIKKLETDVGMESSRFCIIVGTDPTSIHTNSKERIDREIGKLIERQDAGAEIVQTQPVFDTDCFEFLDRTREQGLKIPVLLGVVPLRGKTDSSEIENRYGITIPKAVKSQLSDRDLEKGKALTVKLVDELVTQGARNIHVYPREDPDIILRISQVVASQFA